MRRQETIIEHHKINRKIQSNEAVNWRRGKSANSRTGIHGTYRAEKLSGDNGQAQSRTLTTTGQTRQRPPWAKRKSDNNSEIPLQFDPHDSSTTTELLTSQTPDCCKVYWYRQHRLLSSCVLMSSTPDCYGGTTTWSVSVRNSENTRLLRPDHRVEW